MKFVASKSKSSSELKSQVAVGLISFFTLLLPVVISVVFNHKTQDCGACLCPEKENNPICVNENSDKKRFVTYLGPCEFMCTALCNEHTTRFMYCGPCDNRTLELRGSKGVFANFTCLSFLEKHDR